MSLREQIEAKSRRHITVQIQVSDLGLDARAAAEANALALAAQVNGSTPDQVAAAAAVRDAAFVALEVHFADVEFQALSPDDFEALLVRHSNADGDVGDRHALCAELAAVCVVDEDLADADWWAAQFASDRWSKGELDNLYLRLFTELNYSVPSRALPKG